MMRRRTGGGHMCENEIKSDQNGISWFFLGGIFRVCLSETINHYFRLKRTQQASTSCDGGGWLMLSRL